jgi:uncharacterized protein YjbI with pentapeptide repeats
LVNGWLLGPLANLDSANLGGLDLSNTNLSGASMTSTGLIKTDLSGSDLSDADLWSAWATESNLSGADLTNARLTKAGLFKANLTGATVTGANVSEAYLGSTDLSTANLTNANLTSAKFKDAILAGTTLTGANLNLVSSGGITGTPSALPTAWALVNGYLVGPGADLTDANLASANLAGLDLTYANLGNANLTSANLSGANLTTTAMLFANLTNANLTSANAVGLGLSGANLSGANFTGANLTDAEGCSLTVSTPVVLPPGFAIVEGCLATKPEGPVTISVNGNGSSATVSWLPPFDDGGAAVTGYQVTVNPGARVINAESAATAATVTGLTAGVTYTFVVKAVNAVGMSPGLTVTLQGTTVTAKASASTVSYGSSTTLTGALATTNGTGVAYRKVNILAKPSGATGWTTLGTATTSSTGKYTFTVKPTKNTYYAASYTGLIGIRGGGMDNGGAGAFGRMSSSVLVSVAPKATIALNDSTATRSQTVYFSGTISPNAKAQTVYLQRFVSGKWSSVKSMKLTTASTYRFSWKPTSSADYSYRVYVPARSGYASVVTSSKKLTVA